VSWLLIPRAATQSRNLRFGLGFAHLSSFALHFASSSTVAEPAVGGNGDGQGPSDVLGGDGGNDAEARQQVYVTGMLIALGGILMFFAALISAWVVRRGFPNTDWQPIRFPRILWLNTLILATSSITLVFSRHCLAARRESEFRHWWHVTTILGTLFLAGQLLAWRQMFVAGLFLVTNPNSSFFYVFTAAHGLHILGGLAALVFAVFCTPKRLTRETATRVVALYWHFLAAIWVLIFAMLALEG